MLSLMVGGTYEDGTARPPITVYSNGNIGDNDSEFYMSDDEELSDDESTIAVCYILPFFVGSSCIVVS